MILGTIILAVLAAAMVWLCILSGKDAR